MQRKLAAILSADLANYSGQMEADEAGTLDRVKEGRTKVVEPQVAAHGGRIFKLMGDGLLAEFASVVQAVNCALAIQGEMTKVDSDKEDDRHARYRIGINVGDVIIEGDDIYGDGVNVASRLQMLAPEGGIALSRMVRDQVQGKMSCVFEDLGEHTVKNIERPIHVFAVRALEAQRDARAVGEPSKLSICVLPFANISDDPQQEYFSDGITEDIITDLSKVSALRVIARNNSFQFKGKSIDTKQVGRQLNVSHLLEGSVRKVGRRVRITAQLIEARTGSHLWAERYDRDLDDIFALQDEISAAIVKALRLKLLPEEKSAIAQRGTANPDAYDLYKMARQLYLGQRFPTTFDTDAIIRICENAIKIDPNYALPWAHLAWAQAVRGQYAEAPPDTGLSTAEHAIALDNSLADAHMARGLVLTYMRQFNEAERELKFALDLDPESPGANYTFALLMSRTGRASEAIPYFKAATASFPNDSAPAANLTLTYLHLGDMEGTRESAKLLLARCQKELEQNAISLIPTTYLPIALAALGEKERAVDAIRRTQLLFPDEPIGGVFSAIAYDLMGDPDEALSIMKTILEKVDRRNFRRVRRAFASCPLSNTERYQALVAQARARLASQPAARPEPSS
jgi:adenylate cyclase